VGQHLQLIGEGDANPGGTVVDSHDPFHFR
jgi:hypothetical protein